MALSSYNSMFWPGDPPREPDPAIAKDIVAEPVVGWRVWAIDKNDGGVTLTPALADRLAARWEQGQNPFVGLFGARLKAVAIGGLWDETMTAKCAHHNHEAPYQTCHCGFWALRDESDVYTTIAEYREKLGKVAFGRVQMWGRVFQHKKGWRAEHARPYDITVVGVDDKTVADIRRFYRCDVRVETEMPAAVTAATALLDEQRKNLYSSGLIQFIGSNWSANPFLLSSGFDMGKPEPKKKKGKP